MCIRLNLEIEFKKKENLHCNVLMSPRFVRSTAIQTAGSRFIVYKCEGSSTLKNCVLFSKLYGIYIYYIYIYYIYIYNFIYIYIYICLVDNLS